jgi:hypothetical protein
MKQPNYPSQTAMDGRPPSRRPEPAHGIADEDLPVDHHVDEVLAALSDLARLQRLQPSGSESRR